MSSLGVPPSRAQPEGRTLLVVLLEVALSVAAVDSRRDQGVPISERVNYSIRTLKINNT